jgi:hypothetical protein
MQCAKEAIQNCENVLGYLTLAEHCGYRRDATMCNILFLDGYAAAGEADWIRVMGGEDAMTGAMMGPLHWIW